VGWFGIERGRDFSFIPEIGKSGERNFKRGYPEEDL